MIFVKEVLYSFEDGVGIITLNRPKALNALNDQLKVEFNDVVRKALSDDKIRVIILTGEGKAFCAGGDVKDQANRENDSIARRNILMDLNNLVRDLYKSPKPVITAINGYAIGAGLGIALVGDLIVASSNAKLSAPFLKLGLVADAGVSFLAARRIGSEKTKRMLLTGEMIDAETSEKWGLVDWVVEPEQLLPRALELGKQIVSSTETTVDMTKTLLNNINQLSIDSALSQELSDQVVCMLSAEHKERVQAFVEQNKK